MRKIIESLYIGTVEDYKNYKANENFCFVSCCKEPIHREIVGYTGRGCPKDSPEYLFAYRDNMLALNMVDANSSKFFNKQMIDEAIKTIDLNRHIRNVLVFCNKAESRSPSVVFLYLTTKGKYRNKSYEQAKAEFKLIYPEFNPSQGIDDYMHENWNYYNGGDV
jgi:hypothetical protein